MITTLCYLEKENKYLMLHRTKKENDINKNKWLGVGGKLEKGETPEQCLIREVKEETGLDVTDIQYYKSQPWSFSSTLLFGFWCKAHGDSPIQMDENELCVARWADREEEINSLDNASLTTEMIQYYKQGKVV